MMVMQYANRCSGTDENRIRTTKEKTTTRGDELNEIDIGKARQSKRISVMSKLYDWGT